jgi:hypothetical protein
MTHMTYLRLVALLAFGCTKTAEQPMPSGSSDAGAAPPHPGVSGEPFGALGGTHEPTALAEVLGTARVASLSNELRVGSVPPAVEVAGSARDWLTSAGCVQVRRCPGVPGRACANGCLPFPKQCSHRPSCGCVGRVLCGPNAASTCKGREVWCMEP